MISQSEIANLIMILALVSKIKLVIACENSLASLFKKNCQDSDNG